MNDIPTPHLKMFAAALDQAYPSHTAEQPIKPDDLPDFNWKMGRRSVVEDIRRILQARSRETSGTET